jgi:hypothetical protein
MFFSNLLLNNSSYWYQYKCRLTFSCTLERKCSYFIITFVILQKIPTFPELVKVLSHFCCNPDPDDTIAFDAAVLLGKLCVMDENAKFKLLRSLEHSTDTHIKAKVIQNMGIHVNFFWWSSGRFFFKKREI